MHLLSYPGVKAASPREDSDPSLQLSTGGSPGSASF